jgi:N-methylhydantoinase B/acetone carboxylase, alpha subunit
MGVVLKRSAFSPNIRERCDFSCAIFDEKGELCAQASHIPVHLGAMPETMKHLKDLFPWKEGDVAITNDPYKGGTHLPDITVVKPVFYQGNLRFFLVVRAHHADVGGKYPGSMAPTTHIEEEGVIIPPSLIIEEGRLNSELWESFLKRVRNPVEREGDLKAQLASLERGERRLVELLQTHGEEKVLALIEELKNYSERAFLKLLSFSQKGKASFTDYLDDDGFSAKKIPIRVEVYISEEGVLD